MNKITKLLLSIYLGILPVFLFASWNDPDMGCFKYQKDVEGDVSSYSTNMATIAYDGKLYNFITYCYTSDHSKIILRILDNKSKKTSSVEWANPDDASHKFDDITNLNHLGSFGWQPAPVIFNDKLYLFVNDGDDEHISFSCLTDVTNHKWSKVTKIPGSKVSYFTYMSAVVINDILCLITENSKGYSIMYWTKDLVNWSQQDLDFIVGHRQHGEHDSHQGIAISAIAKTYKENDTTKTKLLIGYISENHNARCAEYKFNSLGELVKISNREIANNDYDYSSIALCVGSVNGDKESTGDCVQAFLKKASTDNGYLRYRIKRYQLKDTVWSKREYNLVPQNSPYHMWADRDLNLTVATFPVVENNKIRQYMCLIYRGYDDWDHPLNCAWAETNTLIQLSGKVTYTLDDPENVHYIGYIEGPPPFYLNDKYGSDKPYLTPTAQHISELEFTNTTATANQSEIGFDVDLTESLKCGNVTPELAFTFKQTWGKDYKKTVSHGINVFAVENSKGFYITQRPIVSMVKYGVDDWKGNRIDTTYYFYMDGVEIENEPVVLQGGLVPGDPETYFKENRGIEFSNYESLGKGNNSWSEGGADVSSSIDVESSNSSTYSEKVTLGLEYKIFKRFKVKLEGTFEYETKTSTSIGNEFSCFTRLNEPKDSTDIKELAFNFHWITPTEGQSNWWLKENQSNDDTWCLTYEVYLIKYMDGKKVLDSTDGKYVTSDTVNIFHEGGENSPVLHEGENANLIGYSLSQNYPNPVSSTTTIKYTIGNELSETTPQRMTRLDIFDVNGVVIATLVNEYKAPGSYEVEWNTSRIAPGVYYYCIKSGSFKAVRKLILLN